MEFYNLNLKKMLFPIQSKNGFVNLQKDQFHVLAPYWLQTRPESVKGEESRFHNNCFRKDSGLDCLWIRIGTCSG